MKSAGHLNGAERFARMGMERRFMNVQRSVFLALDLPGFCGERLAHFAGFSLEGDGALEAER